MTWQPNPSAFELFQVKLAALKTRIFYPKPTMNLPDWADTHRKLTTATSAVGGAWRTARFEVARGPMMAVTERGVETITCMVATQTLKTELLLNTIGYHAHMKPGPMLLVEPKEDVVTQFSKERLAPMARATPVLKMLTSDRARGGKDTLAYKEFPGGFLALAYAGSPTELAMRAISVTLLDEIDKYETTKEGDPVLLAEERTATFKGNRLKIRCCSPTWEADAGTERASRIAKSYLESDQRRPFVECPHCGHWQTLDFFRNVHWQKGDDGEHFPMTAALYCEQCGIEPTTRQPIEEKQWTESHRLRMVTTKYGIRWFQTRPFVCCKVAQEPLRTRNWDWDEEAQCGYALCSECGKRAVSNRHAGFQASKLYNPKTTVMELAENWINSKTDPEAKQVFYNTQLGIPYALQAMRKIETHSLTERKEKFEFEAPDGVVVVTVGVDVQSGGTANEGRLELEATGWGLGFESWSLDYRVFAGDVARPELWAELDRYLLEKIFKDRFGRAFRIEAACVDSGGHSTEAVYKFCAPRMKRNVWAIKGRSERDGKWEVVWPPKTRYDPKRTRPGFKPVLLGVNSAKEAIREFLLVDTPGPGFAHFPHDRPEIYFEQLTAERLVFEHKAGRSIKRWVMQRGRANEALDARVYSYGALRGLIEERKFNFEARANMLAVIQPEQSKPGGLLPAKPVPQTPPNGRFRVGKSSWVG